jgi:hypothetical protein
VCKCVMNTNSTETIFDDSIVSITVESWINQLSFLFY